MKAFEHIETLIQYGIVHELIQEIDCFVVRNELWKLLGIETDLDKIGIVTQEDTVTSFDDPFEIYKLLDLITEDAKELGRSLEFLYEIECFQAEIMSKLMPRMSEVNRLFYEKHKVSPVEASKFFYALSNASTYIRMDRVSKNVTWKTPSPYGVLDITINLSKPEKDPKEIALQKNVAASDYPKCLLCVENAGYQGTVNHPARQNHRLVEMNLDGETWYFQYSPYVYYNEHAIVLCHEHRNMKIDRHTFIRLCDFVDLMPHYFIGSNADLHTVGGSILSHDHYQAGCYEMPMMRAKTVHMFSPKGYPTVTVEVLEWPLSVLKVCSKSRDELIALSDHILRSWIDYSDENVDLIAYTDERHNTITPILRQKDGQYEMYLALRNNRKTSAHPEGLFHPHRVHHHIKRENIGLIEVMGLAVLPSRLIHEMDEIINLTIEAGNLDLKICSAHPEIEKHAAWLAQLKPEIDGLVTERNQNVHERRLAISNYLKDQIGQKFALVLMDAGVYKDNFEGVLTFLKEGCAL
ncbi:UDP-glucose--hexose-1-phosphate uridylyltransferase [Fusibacter ferrireducens]|uniref:Galactose-1-phosphate uridylyltransferase n=1 Tax=Fusibacter ferrireducens TaxID=2785058 RepID=A0ABR9ZVX8_9FIRM|nr:UDP-glucose--hexose-1-phosphate uridylyltransferase [Fusibacter ferrireducens]MBF4694614.1 UDP-glucose--hexose-1-phosphate uridylyltransferase [Fusibacter ferrireducens]